MEPLFTAQELETIRAYHDPVYRVAAIDLVVWPLLLALGARFATEPLHRVATRWSARWRSGVLERVWGGSGWSVTLLFALLYFALFGVLTLPLEIWLGFVREHEFGMSQESLPRFLLDGLKHQALMALSVGALAFGLFGLARRSHHWWWWVGIAASLVMVLSTALDPYRSRLYVDSAPLQEGPLRAHLVATLELAKVEFGEIRVVNTSEKSVRVQAAFAGTGPTRTILLTDTLLSSMTEPEIVAAVAHEAGHVRESRWLVRILSPLALLALLAFTEWLFRSSQRRRWYAITQRGDVRVLPVLLLCFDVAMTVAGPISAATTRQRELDADDFAVSLLHDARELSSLLVKLGRINKVDPDPPRWYVLAGVTHPTIVERVSRLQKNATPPPMTPVMEGTSEQQEPGVMR